jgi:LPS-assembly lipoprotein
MPLKLLLTSLCFVFLASCGFQLRGTANLPFETLYIPGTQGGIPLDLKRFVQAGTRTRVVDQPEQAQARLEFTENTYTRGSLAMSSGGRTREIRLTYRVNFRVHDGKGGEYLPTASVVVIRDISYSDADVLAKEAEEANIQREMQSDVVRQILRRLEAATPPKPVVP